MKIKIDIEEGLGGIRTARGYAAEHVIIARASLAKIKAWAESLGLGEELRALRIDVQEIEIVGDGDRESK